jgi:hypothetical protein
MNEEKNPFVKVVGALVDTLARSLVALFDGVKNAIDHANPSLFSLVATLLPFALPLPVAFMTSHSAREFFQWDSWAANVLGFGLEGLGLLVWVKLVDGIIANVTSQNQKVENYVTFLWFVAIAYEAVLILLNVILAWNDGASVMYGLTLLLICFLPALSAAMYGLHRRETIAQLERERREALEQKERERQERRADRKEAAELKLKMQYAAETEGLKEARKFRGGKPS